MLDYRIHYNDHFVIKSRNCEYCNSKLLSKEDLDRHLDKLNGSCPKQPVECIFKSIGCNITDHFNNIDTIDGADQMEVAAANNMHNINDESIIRRENLNEHMLLNTNYHLELIHKYYYCELEELKEKLENKACLNLAALNTEIIHKDSNFEFNNSKPLDKSHYELDLKNQSMACESKIFSSLNNNDSHLNKDDINKNILKKIERIENDQNGMVNDFVRLTKNSDKLRQENAILKESIKQYKTICQDLHKTLAMSQVSLLTLEERLINQEKLSHNGTFLWKISNFCERMQEAKSGRQTSIYSPPFYSDRYGYKMCARLYLNGDGAGKNTHISLFFVLLRGEYDALLNWPFREKVTFQLLDQSESDSKENVVDSFKPDPNSSSFKRPRSEMNIASGLPVFCPLSKILVHDCQYVKNNTMFIRVIVDTKNLEKL